MTPLFSCRAPRPRVAEEQYQPTYHGDDARRPARVVVVVVDAVGAHRLRQRPGKQGAEAYYQSAAMARRCGGVRWKGAFGR